MGQLPLTTKISRLLNKGGTGVSRSMATPAHLSGSAISGSSVTRLHLVMVLPLPTLWTQLL